jgi:ligand-binding sensor domain-containing protein
VLERTKGLAIGPDDTVWVVHDQELWQYNSGGWQRVIEPTRVNIGGVAASPDGSAHAYRMTGTLYSIRDSVTAQKQNEFLKSIADCIAADASGTVWIGTSRGVSRLKDGKWRSWKGAADGLPVVQDPGMDEFGWETRDWTPVTSITIDPTGVTWIAGEGGIARFTEDGWELHASRNEHPYFFHSITTDDAGQIYATGGRNVATYLDGGWQIAEAPDHLLPAQRPLRVIHVRPDGIWVGSEGALLRFRPTSWD